MPVLQAVQALQNHPAVLTAEPNYTYTKQATAPIVDDWFYSKDPTYKLWGMYGSADGAVNSPYNAFGSQADEAWALGFNGLRYVQDTDGVTRPAPQVVVGVIDEGICFYHPDLAENMGNPNETGTYLAEDGVTVVDRANDGIDNDGNGKIDDAYGWDFVGAGSGNNTVFDPVAGAPDTDAHGTHVSGTIGARANNGLGVAGVHVRGDRSERDQQHGRLLLAHRNVLRYRRATTRYFREQQSSCHWRETARDCERHR
jgi:subtilisin family serine protease